MTPEELRALADEAEKSGWTSGEDVRARFWLHDNAPDLTRLCAELAQIVEASQRVLHTHGASSRYCAACHIDDKGRAVLAQLAKLEAR